MTTSTAKKHNADTTMNSQSPNDRAKKKSREETTTKETDSMDYETDSIEPRDIFGQDDARSDEHTITTQDGTTEKSVKNTNTNEFEDDSSDAIDVNDNDQPEVDLTGEESSDEEIPSDPNPFLANLDLANDPIWATTIEDANDLWHSNPEWAHELPYTKDELDGKECEYEDSLECHLRIGQDYLTDDPDNANNVSEWMQVIAHALNQEPADDDDDDEVQIEMKEFRRMAIRLTLSDPVDLFPSSSWKSGQLTMQSAGHVAWVACYRMFGAPWKNRNQWFSTAAPPLGNLKRKSSERPQDSQLSKTVGFSSANKASSAENKATKPNSENLTTPLTGKITNPYQRTSLTTTTTRPNNSTASENNVGLTNPKNSMYLSKSLLSNPKHTAKLNGMKDVGRKFRTYVKLKFSKFNSDVTTEQAEEASTCFKTMMDKVWNIDPSVLILAWKDGAFSKPLKARSEFPKSKDGMSGYVDNLWMQKGKSAYCRALLSHDMTAAQLFLDHGLQSWLDEFDLAINIDRIQAQRVGNAGHLLGYHALVANAENLADAIQNQTAMGNIAVEIRSEFVRFGNKKGPSQRTNTKILQIYTAWDSTSRARRALVEIYSSKAKGRYPLGVQARFIPNVNDTRFIRTPDSLLAHTNSLKKHIKFMQHTGMTSSHTIIELDHFNSDLGMTLRQAIMHIFSSSMENCTLFLAVDTSFYGDCVNFAYREELENEAITMITALPIFLFASLGRRSVWDWFTSDARHEASYYTWDMDRGIVPVNEMDVTNTKLASWEQLDDVDDDADDDPNTDTIIQPFRLLLDECGENGFNDNGTIRTQIYQDKTRSDMDDQSSTKGNDDMDSTAPSGFTHITSVDSTETSTTPSTLTRTPDKDALLEEMAEDPEMIAKFESMMLKRQLKAAQAVKDTAPGTESYELK